MFLYPLPGSPRSPSPPGSPEFPPGSPDFKNPMDSPFGSPRLPGSPEFPPGSPQLPGSPGWRVPRKLTKGQIKERLHQNGLPKASLPEGVAIKRVFIRQGRGNQDAILHVVLSNGLKVIVSLDGHGGEGVGPTINSHMVNDLAYANEYIVSQVAKLVLAYIVEHELFTEEALNDARMDIIRLIKSTFEPTKIGYSATIVVFDPATRQAVHLCIGDGVIYAINKTTKTCYSKSPATKWYHDHDLFAKLAEQAGCVFDLYGTHAIARLPEEEQRYVASPLFTDNATAFLQLMVENGLIKAKTTTLGPDEFLCVGSDGITDALENIIYRDCKCPSVADLLLGFNVPEGVFDELSDNMTDDTTIALVGCTEEEHNKMLDILELAGPSYSNLSNEEEEGDSDDGF
jgi:serine/threonine protein phosphatase PrpC